MELTKLLQAQRDLQVQSFGLDPMGLEGAERCEFIMWNAYALEDEVHEVTDEVGWKPWASSRHVNEKEALGELVDALHFFLNLCLAAAPRGWTIEMLAHAIASGYNTKRAVNARRQEEGYDGVAGKCPQCKRDRAETSIQERLTSAADPSEDYSRERCPCGHVYEEAGA